MTPTFPAQVQKTILCLHKSNRCLLLENNHTHMADVTATWSFAAVVGNAQSPSAPQPKLLKQLEAHWTTAGLHESPSATVEEAKSCLDRILVLGKTDDATFDRVAGFIARATAVPGGGFLQAPVLAHACARSTVKDRHVRSRACQFIAAVLASLPADADVDADVAAGLTSAMLARARDKIVGVRVAAVGECASGCTPQHPHLRYFYAPSALPAAALMRLQDASAGAIGCPVVAQLSWLVQHDAAKDVRAAALGALQLSADTLVQVVAHARDVCPAVSCQPAERLHLTTSPAPTFLRRVQVRACAYRKLAELVDGRLLTPSARVQLGGLGLSDTAAEVRSTAVLMLAKWLADDGYDFERFLTVRGRAAAAGPLLPPPRALSHPVARPSTSLTHAQGPRQRRTSTPLAPCARAQRLPSA